MEQEEYRQKEEVREAGFHEVYEWKAIVLLTNRNQVNPPNTNHPTPTTIKPPPPHTHAQKIIIKNK